MAIAVRKVLILLQIGLLFSLTGCWSSHQINDLAFVTMMGIDQSPSGEFQLSVLLSMPKSGAEGGGGGGKQNIGQVLLTTQGTSLMDAMRKLQTSLTKKLYWAHNLIVVFGEEAARERISNALDFLVRQYEFRLQTPLLVTSGRAEDILRTEPKLQGSLGAEIQGMVRQERYTASTLTFDIGQFQSRLSTNTIDAMTAKISRSSDQSVRILKDNKPSDPLILNGIAIFKQGSLVGYLNGDESRGVLWLLGKVKSGTVKVACPESNEGSINTEYTNDNTVLSVRMRDGHPEINETIHVYSIISEISCPSIQLNTEQVRKINQQISAKVKAEIDASLAKVQKIWQADVCGFGEAIYRKYPGEWRKLASNWHEGGLKELKVNVQVEAESPRSGLINNPINPKGD